jgi:hypothetical protein
MKIKPKINSGITGIDIRFKHAFPEIRRPSFTDTLKFPSDITSLTAANVSDLHGKYTMLFAFALQNLAQINIAIIQYQTEDSLVRNKIFKDRPFVNHQERWKRDAVIDADSQVEAVMAKLAKKKMERETAQMFVTVFEKYIAALSRELSRKTKETT